MHYYIVYQTTNKINGKIYIGTHQSKILYDDYLGSGKHIKSAILKHGAHNFERVNLYVYNNSSEMFAKEAEIVDEQFVLREDTYNIRLGGFGGFDHINSKPKAPVSYETRQRMSAAKKGKCFGPNNSFYGKKHTKEALEKVGAASRARAKKQYKRVLERGDHPNSRIVSCPHCEKQGQLRAMKRWHFDNCKVLETIQNT